MRLGGGGNSPQYAGGYSSAGREIIAIATAITPAKAVQSDGADALMVEMMMALPKMRAHRRTSTSATSPVKIIRCRLPLAGIAASQGWETTVGIARPAPFNAPALLVGSQCSRPGVLTQCSVEEATEAGAGHAWLNQLRRDGVGLHGTEAVFYRRR